LRIALPFSVVRNIPNYPKIEHLKTRIELQLPLDKKIVILQGAGINVDRGSEELVEAFQYLDNSYLLLIIGSGDVINTLKEKVIALKLQTKVLFIDKMPASELRHYTANSDLGVTIDKDTNLNYHFSLPNKVFDYMHAGIPILASRLPEIENIINTFHIGTFIENHQLQHIAAQISNFLTSSDYEVCKKNISLAAKKNNWETEKQQLIQLIHATNKP
jgi:glycosyltransferase involved in cell wall biosynthesis